MRPHEAARFFPRAGRERGLLGFGVFGVFGVWSRGRGAAGKTFRMSHALDHTPGAKALTNPNGEDRYRVVAGATCLYTLPPFMTNATRVTAVMSLSGSPSSATRSAS